MKIFTLAEYHSAGISGSCASAAASCISTVCQSKPQMAQSMFFNRKD